MSYASWSLQESYGPEGYARRHARLKPQTVAGRATSIYLVLHEEQRACHPPLSKKRKCLPDLVAMITGLGGYVSYIIF